LIFEEVTDSFSFKIGNLRTQAQVSLSIEDSSAVARSEEVMIFLIGL